MRRIITWLRRRTVSRGAVLALLMYEASQIVGRYGASMDDLNNNWITASGVLFVTAVVVAVVSR